MTYEQLKKAYKTCSGIILECNNLQRAILPRRTAPSHCITRGDLIVCRHYTVYHSTLYRDYVQTATFNNGPLTSHYTERIIYTQGRAYRTIVNVRASTRVFLEL